MSHKGKEDKGSLNSEALKFSSKDDQDEVW